MAAGFNKQDVAGLLTKQQERLHGVAGFSGIKLDIDFAYFEHHHNFKESSRQDDLVRGLVSDVVEKGLWAHDEGLVPWLERSERAKKIFLEQTKRIVVRMEGENRVESGKGNSYYMIRWDQPGASMMFVTVRLDCISYTDGWGAKVDEQLKLHVLDELAVADATQKLAERQARLASTLGAEFEAPAIEVDWASFVESQGFLEQSDSSRRDVIMNVVESIIEKGLFDSSEGLLPWTSKSARARHSVFSRIGRIVVALSPDNRVESKKGNSYYQIRLVDDCNLAVTARLDCVTYTGGWGPETDEEMDLHVLDELYMRHAIEQVKAQEERLHSELADATIEIGIDWASFITSAQYLERSDSSRKDVVTSIAERIIEKGLWESSEGLVAVYMKGSKRVQRLVMESINRIIVKLQADSSIGESGIGNSYYRIDIDHQDGRKDLIVLVRLDCVTYTDGWGAKVDEKLGLHFRDELFIREAEENLGTKRSRLESDIAPLKPILHVDWDSFIRSSDFLERSESSRKSVVESVVDQVIERGIWDSSEGLVSFVRAHGDAFGSNGLAAIVIRLCPDNRVESETGNSYYSLTIEAGPMVVAKVRLDCVSYTDGWQTKLKHHLDAIRKAQPAPVIIDPVHEYLKDQPEPVLPGPPIFTSETHPHLILPGESGTSERRQMSEEAKAAREKALAAAKARKEAEETKKREAEELRKKQLEEQKRKREEAQAALRARQAQRHAAEGSGGRASVPSSASCEKKVVGLAEVVEESSLSGASEVLKALREHEAKFNQAIGCEVEFAVDWSFAADPAFRSLSDDQRSSCLSYDLQYRLIDSLASHLMRLNDSAAAKEEIRSGLFVRVIFGFDMSNSINSPVYDNDYSRHFELAIRDADLEFRINFNKRDSLSYIDEKLACALNVQVEECKREMRVELDKAEKEIASNLGLAIELDVDWSFTESEAFLGGALTHEVVPYDDLQRQKSIINRLYNTYVEAVVRSSSGLIYLCKEDNLYKEAVGERIARIMFACDSANKVQSSVGGDYAKHWEMKLDEGAKILYVSVNLSAMNDSAYQTKEKWDHVMQLRTVQGMRDAEKELAQITERTRSSIGKKIEALVEWSSFINDSTYTSLSLDEQTAVFRCIVDQHVETVFTGSYGLRGMCNDAINKAAIHERIDSVLFTYDPTNAVNDAQVGGDYAKHYSLELLTEKKQLRFTSNFNSLKESLYALKDKFDFLLNVRVAQKQQEAQQEIERYQSQLASALGVSVSVRVDWESFTNAGAFLAMPLEERGRVCAQLVDSHLSTLITGSSGLACAAKEQSTSKEILACGLKTVVVGVDATNSVNDGASEYSRHFQVLYAEDSCTLRLVINLNAVLSQSLYNLFDKIDAVFDLSVARARAEGQQTLDKCSRKLQEQGITAAVQVDYEAFVTAPAFVARSASEKGDLVRLLIENHAASYLVDGSQGLLALFSSSPDHERAHAWAKAHITKGVVLTYDPTSSIRDPAFRDRDYGNDYTAVVDDDGQLVVRINMAASNSCSLNDLHHKLMAQLYFANARKSRLPPVVAKHQAAIEAAVGHEVRVEFDWRSLDRADLLYFDDLNAVERMVEEAFEAGAPTGFLASVAQAVADVCSTPAGKQALSANLALVHITMASHHTSMVNLVKEDKRLVMTAPLKFKRNTWPIAEWRQEIEWQLGQTVAVAKHYGLLNLAKLEDQVASAVGKRLAVSVDWRHIEAPAFLEQGATVVTRRINTLTHGVAQAVLVRGLAAVCEHPMGKSTVVSTIETVLLSLDPTADYSPTVFGHYPSLLTIGQAGGKQKVLMVRTNKENEAAQERYKERIEFELDLVVRIAESNAQARHNAAQAAVSAAVGREVKIVYDLGFTSKQAFRVLAPGEQADIVTALCASLPEVALVAGEGLLGVVAHQVGKAAFVEANIEAVHFVCDVEKSQQPRGTLSVERAARKMILALNLDEMTRAVGWCDWKARMADVLGVLLDVCKIESASALAPTAAKVSQAMIGAVGMPVEIAWEAITQETEWRALSAGDKLATAHALGGVLAAKALLGYEGLEGLTEFAEATTKLREHIKSVRLALVSSGRQQATAAVAVANGLLTVSVPLMKVAQSGDELSLVPAVRYLVEKVLDLKPLIEAAVVKEIESTAAAQVETHLSKDLGKIIKVSLDWAHLFESDLYRSTEDYVSFLRQRISSLASDALVEPREGLGALWRANASAKRAMADQFSEVKLRVDTKNLCKPPQFRFIPQYYKVEASGPSLVVYMQIQAQSSRGCGPVVEWVVTPEIAAAKEKAEITRIATERRNEELARRDSLVREAQRQNERDQEKYQRDVKQYERDMAKYEKDSKKPHAHCKGTGWMPCQDQWHRGKSIMKICSSCKGKGGRKCLLCKGTGLNYPDLKPPKMPKPPKMKALPTFPPIDSIDFTRNIS